MMKCGLCKNLGEKARDVFLKSKLPVDKLSQIWYSLFLTLHFRHNLTPP